jgi:uncharacterized membrane protein
VGQAGLDSDFYFVKQSTLYYWRMDLELQAAEKQAFHRAALEDGILDILCGLCFVAWGFLVEAGQAGLGGITFAVIYPTGFAIRKRLIAPRIGHVTLKEQTVRSKRLLMIGLFTFTAVAGLALYLASDTEAGDFRARMDSLGVMVLAFPLALIATMIGLIYGAKRGHAYAVAIMLSFLGCHLSIEKGSRWDEPTLPLMISGTIVLLTGITLCTRFMRSHPISDVPSDLFDASR